MIVREMEREDISEVQYMMKDLQDSHANMAPEIFKPGTLRNIQYYEKLMSDKDRIVFVAIDASGKKVGFVKGKIVNFPETEMLRARRYGYVDGIFVKKEYRGQLIEYKLQKTLFKWFKREGLTHVEANVWDFNDRAKKYYLLFGYTYLKHGLQVDL